MTKPHPFCPPEEIKEDLNKRFNDTNIDIPKTSAPAERALLAAGITSLQDLSKYSEKELLELHGMGPKAVRILREAMKEKDLEFRV